ncbi:MAG TPA: hypothetical protein VJ725_34705 [Thermoanaerobaculia bacterium]|nr:hypothetical protein [Thermoanaerobaculia bacterium]
MKKVCLATLLLCLSALSATAGVPAKDPSNTTRTYGYVLQNTDFGPIFGDGFLVVHIPSLGDDARLDYLYSDKSGAQDLLVNQWFAIDGYLDSEVGCADGPNTKIRPLIVYRWTGSAWQRYDHDLESWLAWP